MLFVYLSSVMLRSIPPYLCTLIKESKVLSILGFHFDFRLTWGYVTDSTVRRCRQRLECLRRISEYLGTEGLSLAYRAFVRSVAEYGGILLLGARASATQLSKLDCMQQFAEQLCSSSFVPLSRRRHAASLGLLCKLLDGTCREHLQMFCPAFLSSVSLLWRSQRLNLPRPYLLINPIIATSLDLFHRSFLGCIADIWNNVQLHHIRSSVCQSWTVLLRKMQNVICTV